MSKEEMLYALRDYVVDGEPSSGIYIINPIDMYKISKETGCCFINGQLKSDWRRTVELYFNDL